MRRDFVRTETFLYFTDILFVRKMEENGVVKVEKGVFGADMKLELLNDGPVTIVLNSKELPHK